MKVRTCKDVLKRQQLNGGWSIFNTIFNINPGNQDSSMTFLPPPYPLPQEAREPPIQYLMRIFSH